MEAYGIVAIIAKVMVLCDAVLDKFVTVSAFWAAGDCNIVAINAGLTGCGTALVDQLTALIYYLVQLGGQLLPALAPIT
jgi:hypothetical protein